MKRQSWRERYVGRGAYAVPNGYHVEPMAHGTWSVFIGSVAEPMESFHGFATKAAACKRARDSYRMRIRTHAALPEGSLS